MWNLLGLLVAFALTIVMIRRGRSFGLAMLLASAVLAVFSHESLPFREALTVFGEAATSLDTLTLTAGVTLIGILANVMEKTGEIRGIIENLRMRVPREGILAVIPAVFGLLPIPGGALMSAPMVDEEGRQMEVSKSGRVFLNLWFRHMGLLIFPLSAPLILLAHEAGVKLHWLILIQVPVFLISILVGIFIIWRETRGLADVDGFVSEEFKSDYSLGKSLAPILVSIVIFFILSYLTPFPFYPSLAVAIPIGIIVSFWMGKVQGGSHFEIVREGFSLDLALAVFGIMIFYRMIQASGLAASLSDIFLESFLPVPVLIVIISFFLGFSMGHNLGAVGVSYSILAAAVGGDLPLVSLLYISSFFGYLISPIHLCVVVSYDFFGPDLADLYKLYLPPSFLVLALSAGLMLFLG